MYNNVLYTIDSQVKIYDFPSKYVFEGRNRNDMVKQEIWRLWLTNNPVNQLNTGKDSITKYEVGC